MRTSPLPADFIHARACKPICEKYLTLPYKEKMYARFAGIYSFHLTIGITQPFKHDIKNRNKPIIAVAV